MRIVSSSRVPSALILCAALVACAAYGVATSEARVRARHGRGTGPSELETVIAKGEHDAETWLAYAREMEDKDNPLDAAAAYMKVLESDPFNRFAQLHCALSLAAAGDVTALRDFMTDLTIRDAKLATEIFRRKELKSCLANETGFAELAEEAANQAND